MSFVVHRSDVSEFKKRFAWLALAVVVLFLILVARLFQLQIIDGDENRATARDNIIRRVTLATTRGIIRDRLGKVLGASRPAYNLYVVPSRLDMENVWPKVVEYVGIGAEERARLEVRIMALRENDGARKNQQILLKEDISRDAVAAIKTHEADLLSRPPKGSKAEPQIAVELVPVPVRYYPFEEVGGHLLGYMAEVDGDRIGQLRSLGYMEGDRLGVMGVERAWESYLRGTRGWEKVLVDAKGRRHREDEPGHDYTKIIEEPRRLDPIPGRDLRLTIDADIQKAMDKAFRGEAAGGVVLVDVRSGRILGMYSKPGFNPNELSGGSGKAVIRTAFDRLYSAGNKPLTPMLDKTVSGAYPPGSTFKPFTALAALERGLIDPRSLTSCKGALQFGRQTFRCTHNHGPVDMSKAIAQSCNVYFYDLAANHGVEMDIIAEMGLRYGLGAKTGLGLNAEASGRMPTRAWMTLHNHGHFQLGYNLNASIGQGATTVNVLQLALAYAALANGGTLYQPQLVRAVETSNGTVVQEFTPRVRRQIDVKPEHLKLIQKALESGVKDEGGTSRTVFQNANLIGLDVAGKTGTAQVSHHLARGAESEKADYFNKEHAWWAGYAPVKSPEVAVVALVEHGGFGGKHAGPIAFDTVRAYQEHVRSPKPPGAGGKPPKPGRDANRNRARQGGSP